MSIKDDVHIHVVSHILKFEEVLYIIASPSTGSESCWLKYIMLCSSSDYCKDVRCKDILIRALSLTLSSLKHDKIIKRKQ